MVENQVLILLGTSVILLMVVVALVSKLHKIEEARRRHTRLPR